ncbi:hypothetical protein NKI86_20185 [Mesorhizobium sp. M0320]|uniref:hypothetical protein n=1 Tax=Mesorhizobium sp. M0320 TaxID=2956936 RepID=UPI00333B4AF3
MPWIAAAIVAVAVLYFAINYSGFRRLLAWLVAAMIVVAAAGDLYIYQSNERAEARNAYAKTLIKPDEIDLIDLRMSPDTFHSISGKIRNRSAYRIKSVRMKIRAQDCLELTDKCDVVGEAEYWAYDLNVPPQQLREFGGYVSLKGMPAPTYMRWNYTITEIEADP